MSMNFLHIYNIKITNLSLYYKRLSRVLFLPENFMDLSFSNISLYNTHKKTRCTSFFYK